MGVNTQFVNLSTTLKKTSAHQLRFESPMTQPFTSSISSLNRQFQGFLDGIACLN